MPTKNCPIRNHHIEEHDLNWDLEDKAECLLKPEGIRYKITIEAFKRISAFSPLVKERLADWVSKQHNHGTLVPTVKIETLVSLGLNSA